MKTKLLNTRLSLSNAESCLKVKNNKNNTEKIKTLGDKNLGMLKPILLNHGWKLKVD